MKELCPKCGSNRITSRIKEELDDDEALGMFVVLGPTGPAMAYHKYEYKRCISCGYEFPKIKIK